MQQAITETSLVASLVPQQERRASPRFDAARQLLARPLDPEYKEEVQTTSNTSHSGVYFKSRSRHYRVGMRVSVVLGYSSTDRSNSTAYGQVVRIDRIEGGLFGIAVQILMR